MPKKITTLTSIMGRAYEARRKAIVLQHKRGWRVSRIAAHHEITRARVYQILKLSA